MAWVKDLTGHTLNKRWLLLMTVTLHCKRQRETEQAPRRQTRIVRCLKERVLGSQTCCGCKLEGRENTPGGGSIWSWGSTWPLFLASLAASEVPLLPRMFPSKPCTHPIPESPYEGLQKRGKKNLHRLRVANHQTYLSDFFSANVFGI